MSAGICYISQLLDRFEVLLLKLLKPFLGGKKDFWLFEKLVQAEIMDLLLDNLG